MEDFFGLLKQETEKRYTENGDISFVTTGSANVDFFGAITYLRFASEDEVINMFKKALREDRELAVKMLFFARDCRGGLGEKRLFRLLMSENYELITKNLHNIVEFGSWKDILEILYLLVGDSKEKYILANEESKKVANDIVSFLGNQIDEDIVSKKYSLLPKWLPTINSSSKITKNKAKLILTLLNNQGFKLNYRQYCLDGRNYLDITERKIAENNFSDIDYSKITSRCMFMFSKLFSQKDSERFGAYLNDVSSGKAKMKMNMVNPYEIVEQSIYHIATRIQENISMYDIMWNNLPKYIDTPLNALCMCDTSGSMSGIPEYVAKSLSIYLAQNNPSPYYRNKIMTFDYSPSLIELKDGDKLSEILESLPDIVANTDIYKAFKLILDIAVNNNLKQEQLPEFLIIISDMQFDECGSNVRGSVDKASIEFAFNGYKMPNLIFWNVDTDDVTYPTQIKNGVMFCSGFSPILFKTIATLGRFSPLDLIKECVMIDRYKNIYCGEVI